MKRLPSMLPLVLWLTVVWVGLWGSVTVANVLGGIAVAVLLVVALPLNDVPDRAVLSLAGIARFAAFFAVDLLRASAQVVVLAFRPQPRLRQAVVAVPVRGASDRLLTLVANAISLTPGTLTLEVDRPRSTLYVHIIDVGEGPEAVEDVRAAVQRLERLAIRAFGSAQVRAALAEDDAAAGPSGTGSSGTAERGVR